MSDPLYEMLRNEVKLKIKKRPGAINARVKLPAAGNPAGSSCETGLQ
jgi:hypothetical protein